MKEVVRKQADAANDYALAKQLNERVIKIFTLVVDYSSTPDITAVNRSYVLLVDELKQIYTRQPELKKIGLPICWRVLGNLEQIHETAIEYTHFASDYGQEHNSDVSRLCIIADKDKPDLTPQMRKLLNETDKSIAAFKSELDKMYAALTFEKITIPVVTIGDTSYRLPSMRNGLANTIVSHCFEKHPNQPITLKALKSELKLEDLNYFGMNNLRENIRNSIFGEKDVLSPFVTASPQQILVKRITALTDKQIEAIKAVSK